MAVKLAVSMSNKPSLALVTPALAQANNGNWQTAARWARMLAADYAVELVADWSGGDQAAMVALHARRSAGAIARWRAAQPRRPLVVVLTGTDLYRDIDTDAQARRSLELADRLVVLNECGAARLPAAHRAKVEVVLQSAPARQRLPKTTRRLNVVMAGHLRDEKSPRTLFDAARRLVARSDIRIDHIGGALDPALGEQARAAQVDCPAYRWLGALPHAATRARIQRAHVLVNASVMEGGAQVVIEAIVSGTPVLVSRVDGHLGLVGADYPGSFAHGDAQALATLLQRCRDDPAMLPALWQQCAARAPLFDPMRERDALRALMSRLLSERLPA
jgi:putative glycosyltransferase (TIGR04348 family)